jgi:PHD-finger
MVFIQHLACSSLNLLRRYCNSCRSARDPPRRSDNRLFEKLIDKMKRMNPVSFHLPKDIRNYFEGVTTGEDGEYQETFEIKQIRSNTRGYIDEPDPFRLRDKLGRPVFCYRCGDTASSSRRILSCDHCSQHWHMDCLDPPLTSLPPLTKKWMCPLHASHAYRRTRKPKHKVRVLDVSLPRGFKNWGDIEIENDENSEEEEKMGHKALEDGFESDFAIDGTTYRLPEKGVKLDFLDKIHMYLFLTMKLISREKYITPSLDDMYPRESFYEAVFTLQIYLMIEIPKSNGGCP